MFSFHSKYFVYRELKKAPQKLSFCFKWPDTGTVRTLGNLYISLILLLHIKLINHMTCISCPSQLLKYLLSLQIFSTSDICQFRWLSLQTENVLNYTNFQSWWWDWCLQLQTNFIIVKLQQYFWKNYVQQSERFHWQTHNWQSSSQYGFAEHIRLNMSYLIWLNLSVPIWTKNKKLFSCWGFIDLKKVFDTVDHKIFIIIHSKYFPDSDWLKAHI